MNLKSFLLFSCVSCSSFSLTVGVFQPPQNRNLAQNHTWRQHGSSPYHMLEIQHPYPERRADEDDNAGESDSYLPMSPSSDSDSESEDDTNSDSSKTIMPPSQIPQINFYSTFPNAVGVVGNGLLWFRELSAAIGSPIPIWIFTIPTLLFGIFIIFLPDLTVLNLPFFYPNGETDDPLAAFPPLLDFDSEDVQKFKRVVQKLIPREPGKLF